MPPRQWSPYYAIVGMTSKAVDESCERLQAAFANSELDFSKKKITTNLAPTDIHKDGKSFDLAIAAALQLNRAPATTAICGPSCRPAMYRRPSSYRESNF